MSYRKTEEYQNRLKKLEEIRALGVNPYPHSYPIASDLKTIFDAFSKEPLGHSDAAEKGETAGIKAAGRIVLFRPMGKNIFAQIQDQSHRLQLMFNRDHTVVDGFTPTNELSHIKFIEKKLDLGDIIGVEGNLFFTQKGELTIYVKKMTLLSKSLLPLPDKHSGLSDKGIRYRKRWVDLIANKESLDTLLLRSKIIKIIRQFFDKEGFLEVETAILQNVYGGADADPFKTFLNALHQEMFLRISLEIPLKKLLVGGISKIYEIGKVFRNEGLDRTHNPEFTLMEAYSAYWDYNDVMSFVERIFENIALSLFNTTVIETDFGTIDVKAPWKRLTMEEAIKVYGQIDTEKLTDDDMKNLLKGKVEPDELKEATRGKMIAFIFEEFAEKHLIQPHHIIDHPIETTPLCKPHRNPQKKGFVERFESFIGASEIANAYSELNDPLLQRELLEKQAAKTSEPLDEDFIESINQGMPPAGGFGIGIDRIVMIFSKSSSIRDVIYFPITKPDET